MIHNPYKDRRHNGEAITYFINKFDREFLEEMAMKREQLKRKYHEEHKDL